MPRKEGTGPRGKGPSTGKGMENKGQSKGGGRRKGGFEKGPGGYCVCPDCSEKSAHQQGIPCYEHKCPKCGNPMTRG